MARRLLRGIMEVHMIFSWFMVLLFSYHLVFYPNEGGISVLEDWKNIIFFSVQGLVLLFFLLHFFNEQKQKSN